MEPFDPEAPGAALAHVRRDGDVHHLRIGQAKARHQRRVILGVKGEKVAGARLTHWKRQPELGNRVFPT
jgi:hypothetical protein